MTVDPTVFGQVLFFVLAAAAVGTALLMVTRRNPVTAAVYLVVHFFALGGLYLTLQAQFIAVIQILVYAGAIMVLFVFVIMLLNLGDERRLREGLSWKKVFAAGLSAGVLAELVVILFYAAPWFAPAQPANTAGMGTAQSIGLKLYTAYLFPFEVTSLLLLAAIIGALILAKRKVE